MIRFALIVVMVCALAVTAQQTVVFVQRQQDRQARAHRAPAPPTDPFCIGGCPRNGL